MKRRVLVPTVLLGACVATPSLLFAQSDTGKAKANENANNQTRAFRVSKLMDAQVQDQNGEQVGEIDELAIHPDSGKVMYAIVSTGGNFSGGGKHTAIPVGALKFTKDGDPVRLNIDKNRFKDAGEFDIAGWDNVGDVRWGRINHQFYGIEFDGSEYKGRNDSGEVTKVPLERASELLEWDVITRERKITGEVEDLVFDDSSDRVEFVVVDFEGIQNADNKRHLVPLREFRADRNEKQLALNIADNRLNDAPAFEEGKWPDLNQRQWNRDVVAYYRGNENAAPDRNPGKNPNRPNRDDDDDDKDDDDDNENEASASNPERNWVRATEYRRLFDASKMRTINGTVIDRVRFEPENHSPGIALKIKPDSNQDRELLVHLGPAWFFDHQQLQIVNNDKITVKGARADFQGDPVILATEITIGNRTMVLRDNEGNPVWDVVNRDRDNR